MKTYLIDGTYYGTQADAKAACKAQGIKFDADFHEENVPTDKDGLLAYVNRLSAAAQTQPQPAAQPAQGSLGGASAIMDRMDRGHAEQALKDAKAAIEQGLKLIRRPHSEAAGAEANTDSSIEELMDDGPIAGDPAEDLMS